MKRLPSLVSVLVGLVVIALIPGTIQGQSLRGSPASVDRMYDHAVDNGIYFYKTGDGIKRIFTNLPAKGLVTDIECEARDREQLEALIKALRDKGYSVSQVELD